MSTSGAFPTIAGTASITSPAFSSGIAFSRIFAATVSMPHDSPTLDYTFLTKTRRQITGVCRCDKIAAMLLESLEVLNFRNLRGNIRFAPGLNILAGENGQGKTNWLEAIGVLAS